MTTRTLVIGGGIIGMLTARELLAAGARVTLIDRQQPARESTWAGGGIVSPLFPWRYLDSITALASWSQAVYPSLCETLHKDTGIDPEFTQNGMLMVADEEIDTALAWAARCRRPMERIDRRQFQELEPEAAHPPEQGLWMPQVGQLRNPRMGKALLADLVRRGVDLVTDTEVRGLICQGDVCSGVQTNGGRIQADRVVVCAGAWSGQLLRDLPQTPDIRPVRGQMLLFQTEPGTIRRITLEAQRYIIPRRDGLVLYGSSMEEVGFDKSPTDSMRQELLELVCERFPVMCDKPLLKHWAGLRPGSPAGVPYIARHPELHNLFINAGQYRNGVVTAPASARLAADLVLDRPPILDPAPYAWNAARG
jgi:glycine oxidase